MVSNPHSPEECETENVKELGESKRTLCLPFAKVTKTERGCLEIRQYFEGNWQTVHLCDIREITELIEGIKNFDLHWNCVKEAKKLGESKRTLCLPFAKVTKTEGECLEIQQYVEGNWQTVHLCDIREITELIEGIVSVFVRVPPRS